MHYIPTLRTNHEFFSVFCSADGLFGSCQSILDRESSYLFDPTDTLYDILKVTLEGLLDLGYGWPDQYTQCIVGGLLNSYKHSVTPDLYYCDNQEKSRLELITG